MLGRPNTESAILASRSLDLGFKRIWAVRAWTGDEPTRYEVEGVVHRHPVARPFTAGIAARLVGTGVPLLIRDPNARPENRRC